MHSDDEWHESAERIASETYLSTREAQVLLVASDMGIDHSSRTGLVDDVANRLGVETSTVNTYIQRAQNKRTKCDHTQRAIEDPQQYIIDEAEADSESGDGLASIFG